MKDACSLRLQESDPYAYVRWMDAHQIHDGDWAACVNSCTLPDTLRRAVVQGVSFFDDIARVHDPLANLLSKALNSRCHARKYGTVAEKHLFGKRHIDQVGPRRTSFRLLVLCSLLGNYPHCGRARMWNVEARRELYRRLTDRNQRWFQSLLHGAAHLVVWCVRDFLVHCLRTTPALCDQVREAMRFDVFAELTQSAMAHVRRYFDAYLARPWSHLAQSWTRCLTNDVCRCVLIKNGVCQYTSPWWHDAREMLRPLHEQMLEEAQYYKPRTDVVAWLVSSDVRKYAPMVALYDAVHTAADSEELVRVATQFTSRNITPRQLLKAVAKQQKQQHKKRRNDDLYRAVTPEHFRLLQRVLDAGVGLDEWVREYGPLFSATPDATRVELQAVLEAHRTGAWTKAARLGALSEVRRRDPVAYNLVQVVAQALKERGPDGSGGRIVGWLSAETQRAQIVAANAKLLQMRRHLHLSLLQAVQKCKNAKTDEAEAAIRADLEAIEAQHRALGPHLVERSSVFLHFCVVCRTVYSNVRGPIVAGSKVKYYRYGLSEALRAYTRPIDPAASTFCRNTTTNHRGTCGLLTRANLLGCVYSFDDKLYQLCVGCADIMTPESAANMERVGYRDSGVLCAACTRDQNRARINPTKAWVESLEKKCACCMRTQGVMHLYPHGLLVCKVHATPQVTRHVTENGPWPDRATLRQAIIDVHRAKKQRKRDLAAPLHKRRMLLAKQRQRAKKA